MRYINLLWNLYRLKRNTTKTKEQISKLQDKKLKRLLVYAYDHSPYYRRTFEESGITRRKISSLPLSDFPAMDKSSFLKHYDELVTNPDLRQEDLQTFDTGEDIDKKFNGKYHVVHSSGSTGKPKYFVYDDKAWNKMLNGIIRAALWDMTMPEILNLLLSGPRIAYIAATDGRYGGAMAVSDGIEDIHASQMFLDIKTPLIKWIDAINEFKPNIIIGYPSAIKILGELANNKDVEINVTRIISCGEPLSFGMRSFIAEAFQADVVNIYGASESLALGVEMGQQSGMILFDDLNVIEVMDGNMYLTCLYNYTQPLIRYRISDQLILKEPSSRHECPFTQAEILLGRDEDMMWFKDRYGNRDFLHPLTVEGFCIEGLVDYQFRQIGSDAFEMLTEVADKEMFSVICDEMKRQMRQILREKNMDYVKFYVQSVDKILPDPCTGKKRLIIKNEDELRCAV